MASKFSISSTAQEGVGSSVMIYQVLLKTYTSAVLLEAMASDIVLMMINISYG